MAHRQPSLPRVCRPACAMARYGGGGGGRCTTAAQLRCAARSGRLPWPYTLGAGRAARAATRTHAGWPRVSPARHHHARPATAAATRPRPERPVDRCDCGDALHCSEPRAACQRLTARAAGACTRGMRMACARYASVFAVQVPTCLPTPTLTPALTRRRPACLSLRTPSWPTASPHSGWMTCKPILTRK